MSYLTKFLEREKTNRREWRIFFNYETPVCRVRYFTEGQLSAKHSLSSVLLCQEINSRQRGWLLGVVFCQEENLTTHIFVEHVPKILFSAKL
jgi:hypothetical protein